MKGITQMNRVLVVDDENSMRTTLCEFLKKDGYHAESASNAEDALKLLSSNNTYDVIVTDIIMPKLSGIELVQRIRDFSPDSRIIIMTGEPTVETAINAVQNGASDYLTKPIGRKGFLDAVRHAVLERELIDQKYQLDLQRRQYQEELESKVEQRTQDLHQAIQSIVTLLTSVIEYRDPYTAGHQRRVGNLASAIATKLGMQSNVVDLIRIAGYIHDIGKIAVPSEILCKPGKLSENEMMLIKNHPSIAFEMLSKSSLPKVISNAVLQHHERCDGSGYPNKLMESAILIESQILIVADVIEAMTSHRPYRPAIGLQAALHEISEYSGILYQTSAVNACIELIEGGYEMDNLEYDVHLIL
jgi:putative nucleotidyltransferase with HDIG domain